jgi:hypothetical protein
MGRGLDIMTIQRHGKWLLSDGWIEHTSLDDIHYLRRWNDSEQRFDFWDDVTPDKALYLIAEYLRDDVLED